VEAATPTREQAALAAFLEAAGTLGLSRKAQAALLGLSVRSYQRRLKAGRLEPAEVPAARLLLAALREATVGFGDPERARRWLTAYVPVLGARPVDLLGDVEGYRRVQAALGGAIHGFY